MTTPDIIITVFGALLTLGLGIVIYNGQTASAERKDDRARLIRIETRLEGLDSMREEIQRNRHKIADLVNFHTEVHTRLGVVERAIDGIKGFCQKQHDTDLGNL